MKKIKLLCFLVTGLVTQTFSQLTVNNGGFETGSGTTGCIQPMFNADNWLAAKATEHACIFTYSGTSSANAFWIDNSNACGSSAHSGSRFASMHGTGSGPTGTANNSLIYQEMSNVASSNTCYRATAFVKTISGYSANGFFGIVFVNTNVGSTSANILGNVRAQCSSYPVPTFTNAGNGWYKMTVDWTPPSTGHYYIVIGNTYACLCDDSNANWNEWIVDDVSITCYANAGTNKNNSYAACCVPDYSSVQIGTYHGCTDNQYSWTPSSYLSCTTCQQPNAAPHGTTVYTLTVSGAYCLAATSQVTVTTVSNPTMSCCRILPSSNANDHSINDQNPINIYPSPGDGRIVIETKEVCDAIIITDLMGRVVFDGKPSALNRTELDISKEPKGIYIVKIMQAGKERNQKISIE